MLAAFQTRWCAITAVDLVAKAVLTAEVRRYERFMVAKVASTAARGGTSPASLAHSPPEARPAAAPAPGAHARTRSPGVTLDSNASREAGQAAPVAGNGSASRGAWVRVAGATTVTTTPRSGSRRREGDGQQRARDPAGAASPQAAAAGAPRGPVRGPAPKPLQHVRAGRKEGGCRPRAGQAAERAGPRNAPWTEVVTKPRRRGASGEEAARRAPAATGRPDAWASRGPLTPGTPAGPRHMPPQQPHTPRQPLPPPPPPQATLDPRAPPRTAPRLSPAGRTRGTPLLPPSPAAGMRPVRTRSSWARAARPRGGRPTGRKAPRGTHHPVTARSHAPRTRGGKRRHGGTTGGPGHHAG
jgi:hypothetical protein